MTSTPTPTPPPIPAPAAPPPDSTSHPEAHARRTADEPLTPDFYRYRWTPIVGLEHRSGGVAVRWKDGTELFCHRLWLRENALADLANGVDGIDPVTRESTVDPALLPTDLTITKARIDNGELQVEFAPEGVTGRYHPGWLRHIADGAATANATLPPVEVWTPIDFAEPPTTDGAPIVTAPDSALAAAAFTQWIDDLARYGLARLENVGVGTDTLGSIARRIGAMRDSNFGLVWHVDVDLDPVSTANTALRLPAHTDLPTRETPPGFQFLHCLVNDVDGGNSTMTDGLAVAKAIEADDPDAFDALRTLDWVFFNRATDHDHRFVGPYLDDGDGRVPYTVRGFHPVRAFPAMDDADVDRAYAALRTFGRLANDPAFQIRYRFRPGDLVGFDNRRVLHGREAFDPTPHVPLDSTDEAAPRQRRLHGTYMDTDEVYSRLRVLRRHALSV